MVASVAVDGLRRSCGLAVDQRVDGAMGLVDRHVHRGRVALRNNNIVIFKLKLWTIMFKPPQTILSPFNLEWAKRLVEIHHQPV